MGSLLRRQIVIKSAFLIGNVLLARILTPEVFGIYGIVTFVTQFFSLFGDIGLGAAFVRKTGYLSEDELATTFWMQQAMVWFVVGLVILLAPLALIVYPSLPPSSVWLIRAMAISLILMSLKTVPAILLERTLAFDRIARVDITEHVSYQVVAVMLALLGFGVWSFVLAALIRGSIGIIMIYSLSPWRPSFKYRFDAIRGAIKFGIPYQANNVVNFLKEAIAPLFVGAYAGAAAVGYLSWAKTLAFAPLIISASFERVAFPTFSKIQHDRQLLTRSIERSMRSMTLLLFPVTAFLIALGPDIIRIVFTEKWMPGLWAFYFYCTSPLVIGVMMPMYSGILSLGKSAILLKMTIVLVCLEWGLGIPFVMQFGFTGMAMNQPVIAIIFFMIYRSVLRSEGISISVFDNIKRQLALAAVTGVLMKLVVLSFTITAITLVIVSVIGSAGYILLAYAMNRQMTLEFKDHLMAIARGNR